MSTRLLLTAGLGLLPVVLAGCSQDGPTATAATVQLAVVGDAGHGGRPFAQTLTQEVTATPVYAGDPDGAGSALLTLNPGQGEVCWHTSVTNIALPATASHIHQAAQGVRGPIVIVLSPPDATGEAIGCRSAWIARSWRTFSSIRRRITSTFTRRRSRRARSAVSSSTRHRSDGAR